LASAGGAAADHTPETRLLERNAPRRSIRGERLRSDDEEEEEEEEEEGKIMK